MARLTVRMTLVHGEPNIVILYHHPRLILFGLLCTPDRGRQERVPTLSAKKMLLMVGALPECGVVERDEPLVDDGCPAVITLRREFLNETTLATSGQQGRSNREPTS